MRRQILLAIVAGGVGAAPVWADDDCNAPMSAWQPREAVEAATREMGWQVRRVRSDDGCYKVYARDARGNQIEAKFEPDTLAIRTIEVEFARGGSIADLCASVCVFQEGVAKPVLPPVATENAAPDRKHRQPTD
ncbi:PepSY domain-containing protein [Paracoccaceae bacterium Fryx2]|nr:PepSY domain-containing protein [Paracoccaceae bacterium Fryx2]